MKKYIIIFSALVLTNSLNAQLRINVDESEYESAAMLQVGGEINGKAKGISFPHIALNSLTDNVTIANPMEGLMVYNTTDNEHIVPGYYYWYNNQWNSNGRIIDDFVFMQKISFEELGYTPTASTETQSNIAFNGKNYTKIACEKWDIHEGGNNHTYCAYNISSDIDWAEAFLFAKDRGGYLLTLPERNETNWVTDNLLNPYNVNANLWLGYNRLHDVFIPTSGNGGIDNNGYDMNRLGFRYQWITGEKWAINWENSGTIGAIPQHNFRPNEPNGTRNQPNQCIYIVNKAYDPQRKWDDTDCTNKNGFSGHTNQLIVEFQDEY